MTFTPSQPVIENASGHVQVANKGEDDSDRIESGSDEESSGSSSKL